MTRKDYVLIAAAFADAMAEFPSENDRDTVELVAARVAGTLANDNPRFDRARFLKACGVEK